MSEFALLLKNQDDSQRIALKDFLGNSLVIIIRPMSNVNAPIADTTNPIPPTNSNTNEISAIDIPESCRFGTKYTPSKRNS